MGIFKTIAVSMIAVLALSLGVTAAAPNLTLVAAKIDNAPTIDGAIDDAAWVQASAKGSKAVIDQAHTGDFISKFPRVAYVGYDDAGFYVAFVNYSPDPNSLETQKSFWLNDVVEFFIKPPGRTEIQFAADSIGRVNDNVTKYGVDVAVRKTSNQWIVEMAVPWEKVGVTPKPGASWRFHLNGHQVADGDVWVTWNSTFGTFHNVARFGNVIFGD